MMNNQHKSNFLKVVITLVISSLVIGCSSPEEKAQKYYNKGIELLETDPAKAKLEFQNALQLKKNMTPAIYGLALAAEKQSDWKACFAMLNKVIQEDPAHVEATVKIAQLFLAAGNVDQAKIYFEKAKALDANNINVKLVDAALDLKNKAFSSAVEKAKQVLAIDSANKDAFMILATERFQMKDVDKTLEYLNKGLAIDNKNIAMQMFKIQALKTKGDYDSTVKTMQEVIAMYPENSALRTNLAQYYYQNGRKDEAEKELNGVISDNPTLLQPKLDLIQYIVATKGEMEAKLKLEEMVKSNPTDYDLSFFLVDYYDRQNENKLSDALLNKIIQNAGDKPEGLKAKVKVAYRVLKSGKKPEALKLIDEVLKVDGGQQEALLFKASIEMEEANFDAATLTLRTLLRDNPNSVQGLFLMARTHELAGSTALADESYVQALAASKDSPNIGIPYANSLIKRKENVRAAKVLEDVLKRNPTSLDTIKLLAQQKIINGDLTGAQVLAEQVENTTNSNLSKLIEGTILLKKNDVAGSIALFKKAHEEAPQDMQAILAVVNTYISDKKVSEAQQFLNEILAKDANNYGVKLLLAQLDARTGNLDQSYLTYENAIAQNPNSIQAYQGLVSTYLSSGNSVKAKEVIERGLKALPNSFDLKMLMAELHMFDKAYPEAIKVYDDLYQAHPESMIALNNYVSVIADYETDKDKIEKAYSIAKKLEKTNAAQFLDTLGWVSYRVGKYDEAIKHINSAAEKAPNYAVFQYHLGKVYLAKGDKEKAKSSLQKALTLSNSNFSHTTEINELLKGV